ncbi:MAG: LysM peptidoglycan-binding domain-containing protein [Desulfotomaculaceae bacterium]|nr:LysM peptidoglycan-binding domain-containing protein [Desulfotomaculaceae bacterium]
MKKKNKKLKYLVLSVSLLATTAFAIPLGAAVAANYTVQEGDCLWTVANKFEASIESIKSASNLNSDLLHVGQSLTIPETTAGQTSTPPDSAYRASGDSFKYTVNAGDCLWLIANRFGTSTEVLIAANNLASEQLQPGQTLLVPANSSSYQQVSRGNVTRPEIQPVSSEAEAGELIDWSLINSLFPIGSNATLLDCETGSKFRIHHLFGTNHADCEPLTAEDASIMKECFGGAWSWERRAAILLLDDRAIACSMAGMPHGTSQDIYDNDFDGMFDLHFLNSRTHGTDRVDEAHQSMVHQAAGL